MKMSKNNNDAIVEMAISSNSQRNEEQRRTEPPSHDPHVIKKISQTASARVTRFPEFTRNADRRLNVLVWYNFRFATFE
jgi:hypothetical protein